MKPCGEQRCAGIYIEKINNSTLFMSKGDLLDFFRNETSEKKANQNFYV